MMHDYHDGLPGFDQRQIFHDGCGECERRGADFQLALAHMDRGTFARAWERAAQFNVSSSGLGISAAEGPLLRLLGAIRDRLDRMGVNA